MTTPTADEIAAQARTQLETLRALKHAQAPYDLLRRTAEEYIRLHYAWQRARYGKVRTHLSAAGLLR